MVAELRQVAAQQDNFPAILFVYQGTPQQGETHLLKSWPEARGIADPDRRLYKAFGIERGGMLELMSPGVVLAGMRALSKGHIQGATTSDPTQMPGMLLVQGGRVLWEHDFQHAGDLPDFERLPGLLARALERAR